MTIGKLFHHLKYAGAEELPKYDVTRGVCVGVNIICISIFILNMISGPLFYYLSGNLSVLIGAVAEGIIILGIIAINKKRRYNLANVCLFIIILVATFYFSAILGKSSETELMILFILGLIFFLFKEFQTRVFCIVVALLLLAALEANYNYQFIQPATFTPRIALFVRWVVYAVVISLVLLSFYLYQRNTRLIIQLYSYSKYIKATLTSEERLNNLKNAFFQSISHDIRGAFAGLSVICAVVKEKIDSKEVIREDIGSALMDASDHYKYMLNNFLEVSKFKDATIDNIHLQMFDLRSEIERIAELHQYIANQKNVEIEIIFSFGFPEHIISDKLKITRIIYNLLSNALKFTRANSTIRINISHASESWRLNIADEGDGIPSNRLKRLFLPYETEITTQNPEGVGLGLYITKYLADILGAKICVDSDPNKGTVFEVEFLWEKQHVIP